MKRFLENQARKPIQKITEEKISNKYNNILNETNNIKSSDKEMLYKYIEQPGNRKYVLKSYSDTYDESDRTIVISRKSGNMVHVVFNDELEEISEFIINMCDELGYKFNVGNQEKPGLTSFIIYVL
jgi:hypothetical protein